MLEKFNALALEETVDATTAAVDELQAMLGELRTLLASDGAQALPETLNDALDELNTLLRSLSGSAGFSENLNRNLMELNAHCSPCEVSLTLWAKNPIRLFFPVKHGADPAPKAGKP